MKVRFCNMVLIALNLVGCSKYIDSKINTQSQPTCSQLISYPNYNLFSEKCNLIYTKDKEETKPLHFKINLPKKIRYFVIHNDTDFGFYYNNNQVIFIKTNFDNSEKQTTYEPSMEELHNLIQLTLVTSNEKFNIKNIVANPLNKNLIIRKGSLFILLYNINKTQINHYISLVNTVKVE